MSDHDPTTRSYVPGEWYAVLGPSLVLALPPDRRDLASAAWTLVDAGGSADAVLDLVLADGLRDLAGLALVSTEGERTRAVTRGRAVCLLDADSGETVVDGRSVTTWVEATVDGVRAMSLELGTSSSGPALQVGDGLVRAARVLWPAELQVLRSPVVEQESTAPPVVEQRGAPATSGRRDHTPQPRWSSSEERQRRASSRPGETGSNLHPRRSTSATFPPASGRGPSRGAPSSTTARPSRWCPHLLTTR